MGRTTSKTPAQTGRTISATDLVAALASLGVTVEGFEPAPAADAPAPVAEVTETAKERKNRLAREARAKKAREAKAAARKEAFFGAIHDEQNKADNAILAAWMRGHGVTPNGAAWKACKNGESDVDTLVGLNLEDGVKAPTEQAVLEAREKFAALYGDKHPAA